MWNNSHGKLTGTWQKNCTTKAARKISTKPGRTEKKNTSGQDLCPWEEYVRKRRFAWVDPGIGEQAG